jgi:hypothetical protein
LTGGRIDGGETAIDSGITTLCGDTINGRLAETDSSGQLIIGNPGPGCAGNTINGDADVSDNTGGAVFVANTVTGPTVFLNNVGGYV